MSRPRVRAVVLAAGLGTRLRPLTETVPKPLLPVVGRPLAAHTLERLRECRCEAAALNLHHLGERVRQRFGDRLGSLPLTYSVERRILGTLGALGPLRGFLAPADLIVVVNGDSLCRWPIEALVRRHLESEASATLLFAAGAATDAFGGGVWIDRDDRVRSFRGGAVGKPPPGQRSRVFAGAHVLSRALLDRVPDRKADFITDLYEPLNREGEAIAALETEEEWHDLGTPARYLTAARAWIGRGDPRGRRGDSWTASDAEIDPRARVETSVVEAGARIGEGSVVEASLVLPGARIEPGCRVVRCIVGPEAILTEGSNLEGQMATVSDLTAIA